MHGSSGSWSAKANELGLKERFNSNDTIYIYLYIICIYISIYIYTHMWSPPQDLPISFFNGIYST